MEYTREDYCKQVDKGIEACGLNRPDKEEYMVRHFVESFDEPDEDNWITEIYAIERKAMYRIKYDTFDHYLSIDQKYVGKEGMNIMINALMRDRQHAIENVALIIEIVI